MGQADTARGRRTAWPMMEAATLKVLQERSYPATPLRVAGEAAKTSRWGNSENRVWAQPHQPEAGSEQVMIGWVLILPLNAVRGMHLKDNLAMPMPCLQTTMGMCGCFKRQHLGNDWSQGSAPHQRG